MPGIQIDITEIAAIWMGGVIVLVPLLALAARYGLVPLLDAVARLKVAGTVARSAEEMERRLAGLEDRLARLAAVVERLGEDAARRAA